MVFYQKWGEIPPTRHTEFRNADGSLCSEELFSTRGFEGAYSLLYHVAPPVELTGVEPAQSCAPEEWRCDVLRNHLFDTRDLESEGDFIDSRRILVFNDDIVISVARPNREPKGFYRNVSSDELLVLAEGDGSVETPFGALPCEAGDMIVIPKGTINRFRPGTAPSRLLILESCTTIGFPRRYFADRQFAEHSPVCERDIRSPRLGPPTVERGRFPVHTKHQNSITIQYLANHPFDVVGWDGTLYPYAINLRNFEPVTRRIHTMPDEEQLFATEGAAICCIVPRLLDYHPRAVTAPPYHVNIDCDEVIFNMGNGFMGWNRPTMGVITLHPRGVVHGPKPGLAEKSIGVKEFNGLAVMVDAFRPLRLGPAARATDDPLYPESWRSDAR